jgi:transcriptional regulator with XRE-family HTH domain
MPKHLIPQTMPYISDMAGRPPINPAPPFGAQLAALRKARGWTQPQLAGMLGISLAALTYYERQARNPSAEFVAKTAKLFNVSVDELLSHSVKPARKPGPPSQLEERLVAVRKLPRNKQKVVLQLLDSFLQTNGQKAGA